MLELERDTMIHFKRYIMLVERYFRFKFEFVKRLVISFFLTKF